MNIKTSGKEFLPGAFFDLEERVKPLFYLYENDLECFLSERGYMVLLGASPVVLVGLLSNWSIYLFRNGLFSGVVG